MRDILIVVVTGIALSAAALVVWAVTCYTRAEPEFPHPER